jgi:hypothetical protein
LSADEDCDLNAVENIEYGKDLEAWTYFYFGYSRHFTTTHIYVKLAHNETHEEIDKKILHISPNVWSFFL